MAKIPSRRTKGSVFGLCLLIAVSLAALGGHAAEPETFPKQDYGGRRTDFAVGSLKGFIIEPTKPAPDGSKPWLWYAPTIKRHPGAALRWLMSQLLARGFYVAGVDVGETLANPAARRGYEEFYRHVTATYGLDPKSCLLAQSRGGLNHLHLAAAHPEWVACLAGIYPVADLRSYPGLARAAPVFGLTEAQLLAQLPDYNPIERLAPLAGADIPIMFIQGDVDKTVPLAENSQPVLDRYQALSGRMKLLVVPGHGHEEIPAFFESELLLQFLSTKGKNLPPAEGVIP